eukprot:g226.t1
MPSDDGKDGSDDEKDDDNEQEEQEQEQQEEDKGDGDDGDKEGSDKGEEEGEAKGSDDEDDDKSKDEDDREGNEEQQLAVVDEQPSFEESFDPSQYPEPVYYDPETAWERETHPERLRDMAYGVQREIDFVKSIPRRAKQAWRDATWANFKIFVKRQLRKVFDYIGNTLNYYFSVQTVCWLFSGYVWDVVWFLLFATWCFTLPTFFDEKVTPEQYLFQRGRAYRPPIVDASSPGFNKILRNSTSLVSDIFLPVEIPPSTHKLAF